MQGADNDMRGGYADKSGSKVCTTRCRCDIGSRLPVWGRVILIRAAAMDNCGCDVRSRRMVRVGDMIIRAAARPMATVRSR